MHSSSLRGSDFQIIANGKSVRHVDFFSDFRSTTRLGIVAPTRFAVTGNINLLMAHVTAFFDCYRATEEEFFTYPDFYSFQTSKPKTLYGMFDIWPAHKDVLVEKNHSSCIDAITDRAINILAVPEGKRRTNTYKPEQLAAAVRTIDTCYTYSANGTVTSPDLVIRCKMDLLAEWLEIMFDKNGDNHVEKTQWKKNYPDTEYLEQSFRRIELNEALQLF